MPRKRRPLVINGETVELDAPGLEFRERGGRLQLYWVASKDARARGYVPRTVPLGHDVTSPAGRMQIERTCRILTEEMRQWLVIPERRNIPIYNGTVESLIECYERDPQSPFHDLAQNTQQCYRDWCKALRLAVGKRRVDALDGRDIRAWFSDFMAPAKPDGPPRVRHAIGVVKQMLPILLSFGSEISAKNCPELLGIFEKMVLRVPRNIHRAWRASRPKKMAMTFAQAQAVVRFALSKNTLAHRSLALGVAAQFEFTLRQIDVIGWWETITAARKLPTGAVVRGKRVWLPGLRFEDFAAGELDLSTSKTGTDVTFDVAEYPLFAEVLATVPPEQRKGPLVVNDAGMPTDRFAYSDLYRAIAKEAGIPPEVWNMRARHGGVTEGKESGADIVDLGKHAQHAGTQTTNRSYIVPTIETTRRVARARVAHRKKRDTA